MKFLEIQTIEQFNSFFSGLPSTTGESTIIGKIEAYSCKKAGSDKKLYRSLELQYQVELSKSPDARDLGTSPFGPLTDASSRKTLMHLISTLNASFPDYDFCHVKPEQFRKETGQHLALNSIDLTLTGVVENYSNGVAPKLWHAIDTEINIKECDIYSFHADEDSDPYAEEGQLWSLNYFFYNKKLKRIIFLSFRAVSHHMSDLPAEDNTSDQGWDYEEMDL
eukprot:TRINITY_DN7030_c0_g1_i1.p1 TRINITY_DN7030_c0_g1~~TRINITY_DN7030_c0_g1_i1.p1  ORF type:complete len:222 (+),score=38.74 TRINITY_DN7030_c0_g1_i1:214-879(+)